MPGRDGRDILRELKSDPATSGIPVIVVSVVDAAEVPELADGAPRQARPPGPSARALLDEHDAGTGAAP